MRLVFWLLVAALSVWAGWEGIQNAMSTDKTYYGIAMAFLGLIGCTLSAVRLKRWREREQRWVEKNGGGRKP
jgi:peptidoglycan/LPS O-acetylase OafA/YrhL